MLNITVQKSAALKQKPADESALGFGTELKEKSGSGLTDIYRQIESHDIAKYGVIPELVGRLPVLVSLDELDEAAMLRILTEPKNAIVKQYKKLFALDGVELTFTDEALSAIAEKTIRNKTGARGLRAIIENVMMDVMYRVPSLEGVEAVEIDRDFVLGKGEAKMSYRKKLGA